MNEELLKLKQERCQFEKANRDIITLDLRQVVDVFVSNNAEFLEVVPDDRAWVNLSLQFPGTTFSFNNRIPSRAELEDVKQKAYERRLTALATRFYLEHIVNFADNIASHAWLADIAVKALPGLNSSGKYAYKHGQFDDLLGIFEDTLKEFIQPRDAYRPVELRVVQYSLIVTKLADTRILEWYDSKMS